MQIAWLNQCVQYMVYSYIQPQLHTVPDREKIISFHLKAARVKAPSDPREKFTVACLPFEIIHCKGMPGTTGSHQRDQLARTVLKLLVLGAFDFGKVVYSGKTGKNTKRT